MEKISFVPAQGWNTNLWSDQYFSNYIGRKEAGLNGSTGGKELEIERGKTILRIYVVKNVLCKDKRVTNKFHESSFLIKQWKNIWLQRIDILLLYFIKFYFLNWVKDILVFITSIYAYEIS